MESSQLSTKTSLSSMDDWEEFVGNFALKEISKAGYSDIFQKVSEGAELTSLEINKLFSAKIGILGKLVQLSNSKYRLSPDSIRLRPTFFLPLAKLLEENGEKTLDLALDKLSFLNSEFSQIESIFIAIDRWHGNFEFEELLKLVKLLISQRELGSRLKFVAPSTVELEIYRDFEACLFSLHDSDIDSIDGGTEIAKHKIAAEKGFNVVVAQELAKNSLEEDRFIDELQKIKNALSQYSKNITWLPLTNNTLDNNPKYVRPLGLAVLKQIAIASVVLNNFSYIRSPISRFGLKLSHVALDFGANDLGYAAIDSKSSEILGVKKYSETVNTIFEHQKNKQIIA